jgi:fatty-acid peroxygenase
MAKIPRDPSFDATLALMREGYCFISNRCDRLGSDVFATRLMMHRAICMRGERASRLFYGSGAFTRRGATPQITLRLLQDYGSVQLLDGPAHRRRKAMFMRLLTDPDQVARIRTLFANQLADAFSAWRQRGEVVLMDEMPLLLTGVALDWVGISRSDIDPQRLAARLAGMIENAGRIGPSAWFALVGRRRTERDLRGLVRQRRGAPPGASQTPFANVCDFANDGGSQLSEEEAVVESLNLLRPIVAVGRFISFAVAALADRPDLRAEFAKDRQTGLAERFAEEVRRTAPFFPFVGGRAMRNLNWDGYSIRRGDWVLFDLYGTNHSPKLYDWPEQFDPGRNLSWRNLDYSFVPQGGGDPTKSHRCPGEAFTVALMAEAILAFSSEPGWRVVRDANGVDLSRIPAYPPVGTMVRFATEDERPAGTSD